MQYAGMVDTISNRQVKFTQYSTCPGDSEEIHVSMPYSSTGSETNTSSSL